MTSTIVRTYKNAHEFGRDAQRLAAEGYTVVSTFQEAGKNRWLRNWAKGGTWLFGQSTKRGKIVVTYQWTVPQAAPMTLPRATGTPTMAPVAPRRRRSPLRTVMMVLLGLIFIPPVLEAVIQTASHPH
jgi:hypothetical protein